MNSRVDYYLDYQSTRTAAGLQYSRVFVVLSRGVPDSLRPPEDTTVEHAEERAADSVARRTSLTTTSIPFGGHWYLAMYSPDSLFVLGQRHALASGDSVLVALIDRADHVGGAPLVAAFVVAGPLPAAYWASTKDPFAQVKVLDDWLARAPRIRDFIH